MSKNLVCEEETCETFIKDHAWGKIKAEGWFIKKDNTVWCPEHIPEWVADWRKRRDREARQAKMDSLEKLRDEIREALNETSMATDERRTELIFERVTKYFVFTERKWIPNE